ncbi:MAG: TonB-dependent receptor [Vicinamibacterales bacterium]
MASATCFGRLVIAAAIVLLPVVTSAQEATITGTITDTTGGVLPGVTITAVHDATGNTFVAVTDETGGFRLPVRTGMFRLTAELSGFTTLNRTIELLVGQTATVSLQLAPSGVQESVTVTGEAPLLDTVSSTLGGNIDPRQMQDMPLNGRNWMDLTMLAPGARQNISSDAPAPGAGNFQLNIDGQEVTNNMVQSFGQPRFSRDSIAEFEYVSKFDASQGRSMGIQVNAITKSGTNTAAGTFSGYFRDDGFIAKDFLQNRVLPYQNQQLSTTFGGPIRRDRMHYFANYEYEREPETFSHSSPWASFNFDQKSKRTEKKGGVRLDFQFTPQTRLTFRGNWARVDLPLDPRYSGGASRHPSTGIHVGRQNDNITVNLTQVLGSRALNEVKAGYSGYSWYQDSIVNWPNHPQAPTLTHGTPIIMLQGYTIGQAHNFSYQNIAYDPYSIRDDFSFTVAKAGRHDVRTGGEFYRTYDPVWHCTWCQGVLDATGGPVPANIEQLFPVWNDPTTWNLAALSPITRSYRRGIGSFYVEPVENRFAAWLQDNWAVGSRLTLNLGVRYDLISGMFAEDVSVSPFLDAGRPLDTNNVQPRLGFAYTFNDRTVMRGGFGKYYGETGFSQAHWTNLWAGQVHPVILNDGRPNFAADPFNGPAPTYEQAKALQNSARVFSAITTSFAAPDAQVPYSYQSSIGIQRQIGTVMAVEADYVFTATRHATYTLDVNLAYDPVTGVNYRFTDRTRKPYAYAGWDSVSMSMTEADDNYQALQMSFTKRMSSNWQASATYALSGQDNYQRAPIAPGCTQPFTVAAGGRFVCDVPITLHPALAPEWYDSGAQRHRLTFNGIWQLPYEFQLSGLYIFGDNGKTTIVSGVDGLQNGFTTGASSRVRTNGTLIPWSTFDLGSLSRLDMRAQKRFHLGRVSLDGMFEVFNLFNRANYGSWVTNERNARYGQPSDNNNIAFKPRLLQFGFRAAF